MKRNLSAGVLVLTCLSALCLLFPGAALAASITINNPSFETPTLGNGAWNTSVPGWTGTPASGSGEYNPTTAQFYGEAPDGQNIAWINAGGGPIYQQLTATLTANYHYTLKAYVGWRLDNLNFAGYKVQLLAGSNVLAEDNSSLTPTQGYFVQTTLNYTAGSQYLGQNLGIKLIRGTGPTYQVNFDMVTLDASPVPLPASVLLLGSALLGLAVLGRRRSGGCR